MAYVLLSFSGCYHHYTILTSVEIRFPPQIIILRFVWNIIVDVWFELSHNYITILSKDILLSYNLYHDLFFVSVFNGSCDHGFII